LLLAVDGTRDGDLCARDIAASWEREVSHRIQKQTKRSCRGVQTMSGNKWQTSMLCLC
jgi:hypothetical protein